MTRQRVDPSELLPHPDQERLYGSAGGEHDRRFEAFVERVRKLGVVTDVVATRDTPGLPANTIVSGHRRVAAAIEVGIQVPVRWETYASAAHAREALLTFNEQREKDEWVRTQEAAMWREVEREMAKQRMSEGGKGGVGRSVASNGPSPRTGDTRKLVAKRLDEGASTTDLRFKLADAAREQNPTDPSASPVAKALQANRPVKTVAREFGLLDRPKPQVPAKKKPARRVEPERPRVDERDLRVRAFVRVCNEVHQRIAELLHDTPQERVAPELREECRDAAQKVVDRLRERVLDARASLVVIDGGRG